MIYFKFIETKSCGRMLLLISILSVLAILWKCFFFNRWNFSKRTKRTKRRKLKIKNQKLKIPKLNDFRSFPNSQRVRGTSCKNFSISIFGFLMCSQINVEGWFKLCTSHMVYSHIWVNLAWDYCHFFYILPLWLKTKTLKKHCCTWIQNKVNYFLF